MSTVHRKSLCLSVDDLVNAHKLVQKTFVQAVGQPFLLAFFQPAVGEASENDLFPLAVG